MVTPDFCPFYLFLSETKTSVEGASSLLKFSNANYTFGFDANGLSGLVVFCRSPHQVSCLFSSANFVLCKIVEANGNINHVMFLYGAPVLEDRPLLWQQLHSLISPLTSCLVIGDFNQVEFFEDKLGGSSSIRGWGDFMSWRFSSNLVEVPYSGPQFTWSNKHKNGGLIFERLDRAYKTLDWKITYPNSNVINQPIINSDHAAIVYDSSPNIAAKKRPYQIEVWCLFYNEIVSLIHDQWSSHVSGSPMFHLSQHLSMLRSKV